MILFLTSSPTGDLDGSYTCEGFDTRNGFRDKIGTAWRDGARVLMITAFPDSDEINSEMKEFFSQAVIKSGFSMSCFDLWDRSILCDEFAFSKQALHSYDVIILGGGHVPTQNEFLHQLNLRENMQGFDGIVIGISAGTMNCADSVYAQPEEPGEATDPNYKRFIQGLGITDINVLPHYQLVYDTRVDGKHLFRDISIPDSIGRRFIVLVDGSYVMQRDDEAAVFGKSLIIEDGEMRHLSSDGEYVELA